MVEEVIREPAPDMASADIDLMSDLPRPSEVRAVLTPVAGATGAREGETAVALDLTDERRREWFVTLVPHTVSAEVWGPEGAGVPFSASDTGSAIGWRLPAERWERVRARLRQRDIDPDTVTRRADRGRTGNSPQ